MFALTIKTRPECGSESCLSNLHMDLSYYCRAGKFWIKLCGKDKYKKQKQYPESCHFIVSLENVLNCCLHDSFHSNSQQLWYQASAIISVFAASTTIHFIKSWTPTDDYFYFESREKHVSHSGNWFWRNSAAF